MAIVSHPFVKFRCGEINQFMLNSPLLIYCIKILILRAKKKRKILEARFVSLGSFQEIPYSFQNVFNLLSIPSLRALLIFQAKLI